MYNVLIHYYKCVGLFRHMITLHLDIYTYSIGLLKISTLHDGKSFLIRFSKQSCSIVENIITLKLYYQKHV